ncbi:hypothetical protein GCM10022221_37890 [Actinocorallia aurea]
MSSRLTRRTTALVTALILVLGLASAFPPLVREAKADEPATAGEYLPLWASPLLETVTGIGTPNNAIQKIPAGGTMTFQALGRGGLPASGVAAISVNVHAVNPGANGHLSIYPSDKPTTISTVAFTTGENSTGADITQITATGQITVANNSTAPVDALVAVDGYYKSGGAATTVYKPLTTAVLWDTRAQYATGAPLQTTPMAPWSSVNIQVAGKVGIPGQCDQSAAVALNIVALEQTTNGELKVEPTDSPIGVGTLRFTQNDWNNSTFSIVQVSCTGQLRVTNSSPGTVNVSISVRGYFTYWDETQTGSRYKPVDTTTVVDTATGLGRPGGSTAKLGAESHLVFDTTGPSGVPANTVSAAAMQVRISGTTAPGWITLRPEDKAEIPISSLVYQTGEDAINFDIQMVSGLGRVAITNHGTGPVHVQVSVRGFYIHQTVEIVEGDIEPVGSGEYVDSNAISAAITNAGSNPDLGTVSYDPQTKTVITSATSSSALATAAQPVTVQAAPSDDPSVGDDSVAPSDTPSDVDLTDAPDVVPTTPATTTVSPRAVLAPNSAQSLDVIKDEILSFTEADLPGASAIEALYVQQENNRVVIESSAAPATMQNALTTLYGPSKVAVNLTPNSEYSDAAAPVDDVQHGSCSAPYDRHCLTGVSGRRLSGGTGIVSFQPSNQNQSFWCSAGMKWKTGSTYYALTAGHCAYNWNDTWSTAKGGTWGTGNAPDNWHQSNGSTDNLGDLAFVRLGSASAMNASVMTGSIHSATQVPVKGYDLSEPTVWTGVNGELVHHSRCTSGQVTGSRCGWKVTDVRKDIKYESGATIRRAVVAKIYNSGMQCMQKGDSGGTVYTIYQTGANKGKVRVHGIISGGGTIKNALNQKTGCKLIFTPVYYAAVLSNGGRPVLSSN